MLIGVGVGIHGPCLLQNATPLYRRVLIFIAIHVADGLATVRIVYASFACPPWLGLFGGRWSRVPVDLGPMGSLGLEQLCSQVSDALVGIFALTGLSPSKSVPASTSSQ